ncbi:MAG: LapA family protein [Gemmatimonadales bacterium]|nr:LapA family protein [Gemmatimonadales bacterium]
MWIFKGLLFLLFVFALLFFAVTNSQQAVDINLFGTSFLGISIIWVVLASFLVGFAASFVIAAFREFRFHREIRGLKKAGLLRDKEIAALRTLPLQQHENFPAADQVGKESTSD